MTTTTESFAKRPRKDLSRFKNGANFFLLKVFPWTRRMKFCQTCPKHTFFQKEAIFHKKSKCTEGQVECSFDYPTKKSLTKGRVIFALGTMQKNLSRKMFFLKVLIWTGKMQFWQGSRKFLPGMTKFFAQSPEKKNKKRTRITKKSWKNLWFSRKEPLSLNCFYRYLLCSFETTAGYFCTKCGKSFAQCSKMTEQTQCFQKNLFQKFRLNT